VASSYQALFEEFNQQYFAGRLPHYRVVVVPSITRLGEQGRILRRRRLIELQILSPQEEMVATLLHEMAHAATNDHHAARWQEEMYRLQHLGAPICPEDVPLIRRLTRALVREAAEAALTDVPALTARQFLRGLAYDNRRSQADFQRRYPWAVDVFRTTQKQHRAAGRVRHQARERIRQALAVQSAG
jgi:hypothetical protein